MPKIAELPEFDDLTGDELVVLEKGNVTGRSLIGALMEAIFGPRLTSMDAALLGRLRKSGDVMAGPLGMDGHTIQGVGEPDSDDDAANAGFVARSISNYAAPIIQSVNQRLRSDAKADLTDLSGDLASDATYLTAARLKTFETRSDRPMNFGHVAMQAKVIIDRDGRAGGGPAAYVPLYPIYVNSPLLAINAGYTPANASSSEIPGYKKVALSGANPDLALLIYFDFGTSSIKEAQVPSIPRATGGYVPICSIWQGGQMAYGGTSVISYDEWRLGLRPWVDVPATDYEIVHDQSGLWGGGAAVYGPLRMFNARGFSLSDFSVANAECSERAGYWKLPLGDAASVQTLIFDQSTRAYELIPFTGAASTLPAKYASAIVVARFFREMIHSDFVVRRSLDGLMPNQNPYGRGMVDMPVLYETTVVSDVTDAALTALGFSKGIARPGNAPYAGMTFDQPVRGGRAFFRCWAQTSVADTWSAPEIYFRDEAGAVAGPFPLRLERALSSTARVYAASIDAPNSRFTSYLIGCQKPAGADMILTGFQHHLSATPARDIPRNDWPALAYSPVIGPTLWLASDAMLPLYPANLFLDRDTSAPTITLTSSKGAPAQPFVAGESGGTILLDPDNMGASARLFVRPARETNLRRVRDFNVRVADIAALPGKAVGIFAQGDSIANRQTLAMVNAYLAAWGVSPNWIGTLASSATLYADDASGPSGECREGWAAYGDYLGFDLSDGDVPGGVVPVDGVAAYMAVGKMARMQRQPFLNTDLGAGSAAPIVTVGGVQHRYDLAFYRTRFGLPLWDVHLLNPGMNDYLESPANYRMALGAMIAEARRAAPLAHIVLWQTVMPNTPAATLATAGQFGAVRQTLVELHRELSASDPKLHLCSAWAHQTAEGWPVAADAANALGVSRATMPEWIHPGDAAREQHAFALACTIANLILGNF
ncbi:SGNH/GDSL hydrolase family protein [Sphingobium yanoikuyae]|uniref:SGNH/GDSL hydrolase family protein n=1 Tax=Sphingobium yanoikuyae TaxID=13690 RepID=UPI00240EC65B|nr:SGNH/GDSL hydrolase family protein [Sphingobium yanoikuyae]MDG2513206.1 SGNH/GDSL hydrolase family protein [Sphingobium yanoikuyae]